MVDAASERVKVLKSSPPAKSAEKQLERDEKLQKQEQAVRDGLAKIAEYNAFDPKFRDAVMQALNDWRQKGDPMVSALVTRFRDVGTMEAAITEALAAEQKNIDAAFIDPATKASHPIGHQYLLKHALTRDIGNGFELDPDMNIVPTTRALRTLRLSLRISGVNEFMIETAFIDP
jgi:hypothetical protein